MKSILLAAIACCVFVTPSADVYGQAVWRGRSYDHPVCSNPNCRMCNSIRSQLYTPTYSTPNYTPKYTPTYSQPSVVFQPLVMPPQFITMPRLVPVENAATQPTPLDLVPVVFELLKPSSEDVFIDVGSGDGRILREAVKHKCMVLGVDLQPTKVQGAVVVKGDALEFDYSGVTMAYLYLYPDLMHRVIARLPSGTKIVSYSHTTNQLQWERYGNFYFGTKL